MKTVKTKLVVMIAMSVSIFGAVASADKLLDAVTGGDPNKVKEVLAKGEGDVNARSIDGGTALHWESQYGDKEVVGLLLAKGADVNAKNYKGFTPLHCAVWSGRKEVVELLLAKGADVNAKDNGGMTPLDWASQFGGNKEVIELLRNAGKRAFLGRYVILGVAILLFLVLTVVIARMVKPRRGNPSMSTSDPGFHVPFLAPGLTPWSLVGKIGDNGKPFQVGSKNAITPQSAGELYLSVNDNNFGDNSGSWNVTVQLARGARGSLSPVRYVVLGVAILVFVGLALVIIKLTIPRRSDQ